MKINVVCFTGNSGLTDYSISLARALSRTEEVSVITSDSVSTQFGNMGFKIEKIFRRSRHYPLDLLKFCISTLQKKPDWLILQGPLKFPLIDAITIRALRFFGIKAAVTVHDVLPHYPRPWSAAEFAFYYKSFDRVIAHSEAACSALKQMGIKPNILIVPHGVYDLFDLTGISKDAARAALKAGDKNDFVVLFFGNLEPRKGMMEFLDVAHMTREVRNLRFVVAGSNDLKKHGHTYVDRFNQARDLPNITIHDKRIPFEDVEKYFSACDIVALPYLEGTTSGVLKLAIAFGKPVVATQVGDLEEQIPSGGGLLVPSTGPISENILRAINIVRNDYAKYSETISAAKRNSSWSDIAKQVRNYLRT